MKRLITDVFILFVICFAVVPALIFYINAIESGEILSFILFFLYAYFFTIVGNGSIVALFKILNRKKGH
jgi:hypothetical protein